MAKFVDYSPAVKRQMEKSIGKALASIGLKWEEIATMEINAQPRFGGSPGMGAVDTGLMRSSNTHQVDRAKKEVVVGNPLNYALYTTYGTWKMPRRPWFQNSIEKYVEDYQIVVEDALGKGFG